MGGISGSLVASHDLKILGAQTAVKLYLVARRSVFRCDLGVGEVNVDIKITQRLSLKIKANELKRVRSSFRLAETHLLSSGFHRIKRLITLDQPQSRIDTHREVVAKNIRAECRKGPNQDAAKD